MWLTRLSTVRLCKYARVVVHGAVFAMQTKVFKRKSVFSLERGSPF